MEPLSPIGSEIDFLRDLILESVAGFFVIILKLILTPIFEIKIPEKMGLRSPFRHLMQWLITQKVFLGSGTEKILYMSSERALKMLSFDGNIRCIGSGGGVGEHI